MAIDTASKRASAFGTTPTINITLPSGAVDAAERESVAWLYNGIPADNPSPVVASKRRNLPTMGVGR